MDKFIVFILLIVFLMTSCKSDNSIVDFTELNGRWNLYKAERNGNETSTLDKAFFEISTDKFSHNLEGDSLSYNYTRENRMLKLEDGMLRDLKIVSLLNDTLVASSEISKFNFKFIMTKNAEQ